MNRSTNMHICVQRSIRNSRTQIWLRLKVNITNMKKGKDLKKTNYFKMLFVDPLSIKRAFYVIALYYSSIGVKKYRHTLVTGLLADVIGIFSAITLTLLMFG